ncbi:hypothetical protein NH340_JMT04253 [Sarcoptes scabiei]|nr:hypothetical protein NH340_JMT04253 [Sarcoptes scabiei]
MMSERVVDFKAGDDRNDSNDLHQKESTNKIIRESQNDPHRSRPINSIPSFPNRHYLFNPDVVAYNNAEDQQEDSDAKNLSSPLATNLSDSLRNAFQISNLNMPSLPDYFSQLPSVSMPSMPNISIPSLPTMPTISMPSMPNISMPNISIPNINLPSISDFMPFQHGRINKSWDQINATVREYRRKFISVCPSLPFNFKFCYDRKNENLRIYFLASLNSYETSLYYCDVALNDQNDSFHKSSISQISDMTIIPIISDKNDREKGPNISIKAVESDPIDIIEKRINYIDAKTDVSDDSDGNNLPSFSPTSISSSSASSMSTDSYIQTTIDPDKLRKMNSPTPSLSENDSIEWNQLVNNSDIFSDNLNAFDPTDTRDSHSQEEDLILQRKRIRMNGIISYDFHPKIARFVFTIKNVLYWFDDSEILENHQLKNEYQHATNVNDETERNEYNLTTDLDHYAKHPPYQSNRLDSHDFVKTNATICPYQPDLVAFTADFDLWVCDLSSGWEYRLTKTNYQNTSVMAGRSSFVMQEEFSRFTGFWWCPFPNLFAPNEFTILCEYVDESEVESIQISDWNGACEIHRFPKAGITAILLSRLFIIDFYY